MLGFFKKEQKDDENKEEIVQERHLNSKLNQDFLGKVVRKDLTKSIKEGANVPIYVLEYLLGMYCATDNEEQIQEGVTKVKDILAKNYVRPDEKELIKSRIKEKGRYKGCKSIWTNIYSQGYNYSKNIAIP